MIRITGGEFRGRKLEVPDGIRPSTDMARKAVFDLLGPDLLSEAVRVADVAAGSGAYGLEALSRGAGEAVLVDVSATSARAIRANAERLGVAGRCRVVQSAAEVPAWIVVDQAHRRLGYPQPRRDRPRPQGR